MFSIKRCDLPENSLLLEYRNNGAYTDCYATDVEKKIFQSEYIRAFYTTFLFKIERAILRWAISMPSTDEEARLLADGKMESFAAWNVEARRDNQILLSDYRGRTRSWLMSEPSSNTVEGSTRLYFGSAVVPICNDETGQPRLGKRFSALIQFHKLYSQLLLSSTRSSLLS